MKFKSIDRDVINVFLIGVLSLGIMLKQILSAGYFSAFVADTYTYTSWAWQFKEALAEGIVYPRWMPLSFWGYGSPTFILYSPFAFYAVTFFYVFTKSIILSMNLTKLTALFFSGVGIFYLVKEVYSEKSALIAAAFYIVFPYIVLQYYLIGTFSSTISFMWFAPIMLFLVRYTNHRQNINLAYAGFFYGALIMTHLINAYMFTFVMMAFIIYRAIIDRDRRVLHAIPGILLIGFFVSASYVMPLIYEKGSMNLHAFVSESGGIVFNNFFILPNMTEKIQSHLFWPLYYETFVIYVFMFSVLVLLCYFQMGKLHRYGERERANVMNRFFIGVAISSLMLLFGFTSVLWETIPYFRYIQVPARWLCITAFSVVFLAAVIFEVFLSHATRNKRKQFFIFLLFAVCLIMDYKYIKRAPLLDKEKLFPAKVINWAIEHLPAWVDLNRIDDYNDIDGKIRIMRGKGQASIITWKSAERIVKIMDAHNPVTIRVRTFNFPGWKAYVDGVKTEIAIEKGTGAILVDVPQGTHELILKFEDTPIRYYSKFISLFSILGIGVLAMRSRIRRSRIRI